MPLSPRMPELGAFEVLLAVSSAGSLNAAAVEIGVTQQAVSARMASLESRLGLPLLIRSAQGSVLTPEAVVIAEWADRLLRVAADVDTGLAALHPERRPKLRLASSTTVAEQLLPGWLATYQNGQRPGRSASVALTVTGTDQVVDDVRAGRADLGFVEGIAGPRGLRSRVVATDDLCLVVGPGHAWARRGRAVTAAELRRTPLVVRAADGGQPLADAVPPAAELTTTSAVRAAVVDGAGPALMSRLAVADDLTAQRLREIRVTGLDLRRELRAVWAGTGRTPASPAAADLLAHVPAPATRG